MFNITESIEAQRNYCKVKEMPHFAPHDGKCWSCNKNIYEEVNHKRSIISNYTTGIAVEEAGNKLITGCPHCNRTYCD